jgi:uncharacterized protein YndB with AHSA1/START domain
MSAVLTNHRTVESFEIRNGLYIEAPIEIAWEATIDELEAYPGGRWYRDLGNGAGHLWGHVQVIKPPHLLEIVGPMPMSYPAVNHLQYRLKAEGSGTRLSLVHQAMGLITPEHRDGMPEGWESGMERIKELAEGRVKEKTK